MSGVTSHTATGIDRSLLCVAEFQHRINNEYAKLISFVSRQAALSSAPEVKVTLLKVIDHLNASAKVHHTLRPPLPGEMVDFTAHKQSCVSCSYRTALSNEA
jgi:two-component sensor histidine kinase